MIDYQANPLTNYFRLISPSIKPSLFMFIWLAFTVLLTGCGTMRETLPARSATEQILISGAVDKALDTLDCSPIKGKKVFLDTGNLEGYDTGYVKEALRRKLLISGVSLVDKASVAELTVSAALGALSIDYKKSLIGLPSIPIPVPFTSSPLETPELPIYKKVRHTGLAKLILTCQDSYTHAQFVEFPILRATVKMNEYWVLLTGPYRSSEIHRRYENR